MIVSHRLRLFVFFDPLWPDHWLRDALLPWADEAVAPTRWGDSTSPFFRDMTPTEAALAARSSGRDFDSYTRIAVIQSPFRRLTTIYDRLRESDPVWLLKARAGWGVPSFREWLIAGRHRCTGPIARFSPRWHWQACQGTAAWANGRISAFVRAEHAAHDFAKLIRKSHIVPVMPLTRAQQHPYHFPEMARFDRQTTAIVRQQFQDDFRLYSGSVAALDVAA